MKTSPIFLSCFFAAFLFLVSCRDPGDKDIRLLNRGKGVWNIESKEYTYYDSTGVNVRHDSIVQNCGEIIFFSSKTLDAQDDLYPAVANLFNSSGDIVSTTPFEIYYDKLRAELAGAPGDMSGVWTVEDNGRKKQTWSITSLYANGNLASKITMVLKKK